MYKPEGLIVLVGNQGGSSCGYCHSNQDTSFSYGAWAYKMTPMQYQNLIDKGWRRSGQYLYKPLLNETCCPPYTIRLDVERFVERKSHKKVFKKLKNFVVEGKKRGNCVNGSKFDMVIEDTNRSGADTKDGIEEEEEESDMVMVKDGALQQLGDAKIQQLETQKPDESKMMMGLEDDKKQPQTNVLEGTTNSKSKITSPSFVPTSVSEEDVNARGDSQDKKLGEQSTKKKKKHQQHVSELNTKPIQHKKNKKSNAKKSLEEWIEEAEGAGLNNLHAKFRVELTPSKFEKDSFELYCKYQQAIHGDETEELSEAKYTRFLFTPSDNPDFPGFGAFHQKYYLNNQLVAVAVIDVLPYCLSSVYFMYDPELSFLSLGVYSALREIYFVKKYLLSSGVKYYYMGYYLHSCPKMRYKGQYIPSDILCPKNYSWIPLEKCVPWLDKETVVALSESTTETIQTNIKPSVSTREEEIRNLLVLFDGKLFPLQFLDIPDETLNEIKQFVDLVGITIAKTFALVLS